MAEITAYHIGERTLAQRLYPRLQPDELLTADRGFYSFAAWGEAVASGAALLWRAPAGLELPLVQVLAEGTYTAARRHGKALLARPVWLFSSGPLDDSAGMADIPAVPQAAATARRLGAVAHATFGGSLTDGAKGFIARAIVRNGRGGDFRNPAQIADWSRAIAAHLRSRMPTLDISR